MSDARHLWMYLVYNWETRAKRLGILGERPEDEKLEKGEHLYRAEVVLDPPFDDGHTEATLTHLSEEWGTAEKKPPSVPTECWVARKLGQRLDRAVPPHSYGPGVGSLGIHSPVEFKEGVAHPPNYVEFDLPEGKFRLTVEKL